MRHSLSSYTNPNVGFAGTQKGETAAQRSSKDGAGHARSAGVDVTQDGWDRQFIRVRDTYQHGNTQC